MSSYSRGELLTEECQAESNLWYVCSNSAKVVCQSIGNRRCYILIEVFQFANEDHTNHHHYQRRASTGQSIWCHSCTLRNNHSDAGVPFFFSSPRFHAAAPKIAPIAIWNIPPLFSVYGCQGGGRLLKQVAWSSFSKQSWNILCIERFHQVAPTTKSKRHMII